MKPVVATAELERARLKARSPTLRLEQLELHKQRKESLTIKSTPIQATLNLQRVDGPARHVLSADLPPARHRVHDFLHCLVLNFAHQNRKRKHAPAQKDARLQRLVGLNPRVGVVLGRGAAVLAQGLVEVCVLALVHEREGVRERPPKKSMENVSFQAQKG